MRSAKLAIVVLAAVVCGVVVVGASANPIVGPPICKCGAAVFGTFSRLTINGNAYVPENKTLTVTGNLTLRRACLDAFSSQP